MILTLLTALSLSSTPVIDVPFLPQTEALCGGASVHEALGRPDVRHVAATMGIDLDRLDVVVDTMQGADLEQAASTAREVNQELVGGSSVTLSTTTIIIILLAIILLVVIAR